MSQNKLFSFDLNSNCCEEDAARIKECLSGFQIMEPKPLRQMIADVKANQYSLPLKDIKLIDHSTGREYTFEELYQMLNN